MDENIKKALKYIAAGAGVMLLLVILVTCFSSRERYYEDITFESNLIPKGEHELEYVDGNRRYYTIRSYGDRVLELSYHDYDGKLWGFEDKNAARFVYNYNDDGDMIRLEKFDTDGRLVGTQKFAPSKKKKKN